MEPRIRVALIDDEPLARQRLADLLARHADVEIAATAGNGHEAVDVIRSQDPDLVFLDVQMPGLTGLEVLRTVGASEMPTTIFVTAYDQYALQAFELAAVDYLLKPFDDERFEQALERARSLIRLKKVDALRQRLLALLQDERHDAPGFEAPAPPPSGYLERIAVEMRGQVRVVPVDRIEFITASGPYAELHVEENTYIVREQMQTLEERLDPAQFFRIHRSTIVRLDLIEALLHQAGGHYSVRLKTGQRLKVSRSRREALEEQLGLK